MVLCWHIGDSNNGSFLTETSCHRVGGMGGSESQRQKNP